MVIGTEALPKVSYGFAEPHPRFVVLWALDNARLLVARDAYLAHQAKVEPWLMSKRRYYFTTVEGGDDIFRHEPREAEAVPLFKLVAQSCPVLTYHWAAWVPLLTWWPVHGAEFLASRPEVGWSAGGALDDSGA